MSDTIQSNVEFVLTGTLTQGGSSVAISDDSRNGGACDFTDASILFTNVSGTVIERMKGTASGGTLTLSKRGITRSQTLTEDANLKKEWRPGTRGFVTVFAYDHFDIEGDLNLNGNITPTNPTKPWFRPQSLTQAQIDALPTTGQGLVFNSTSGLYQILQGGAWVSVETGAVTPNASETVAGKVEIATQVETDAGTATGGTGAILAVTPATLVQHVVNVTASQAEAEAGSSNAKLMTPLATQKKIDYTRASDAEAEAGTDTVKFVTPKQAKDNYSNKYLSSASVSASVSVPANANIAIIAATCSNGAGVAKGDITITRVWKTAGSIQDAETNSSYNAVYFNASWSGSAISCYGTSIGWTVYFYSSF